MLSDDRGDLDGEDGERLADVNGGTLKDGGGALRVADCEAPLGDDVGELLRVGTSEVLFDGIGELLRDGPGELLADGRGGLLVDGKDDLLDDGAGLVADELSAAGGKGPSGTGGACISLDGSLVGSAVTSPATSLAGSTAASWSSADGGWSFAGPAAAI